jgi:hypothetical protein
MPRNVIYSILIYYDSVLSSLEFSRLLILILYTLSFLYLFSFLYLIMR